jgi:hypothetical protein
LKPVAQPNFNDNFTGIKKEKEKPPKCSDVFHPAKVETVGSK